MRQWLSDIKTGNHKDFRQCKQEKHDSENRHDWEPI